MTRRPPVDPFVSNCDRTHSTLRTWCTYLVLVCGPHVLDNLLSLGLGLLPVLSNNLHQHRVNLASHVRSVTADVEIRLLLEQVVDDLPLLLEQVLDIDLLRTVTGECSVHLELVTHSLLIFLRGP